ncbi:MAG TPA: efflux RND transporter permease subunit, partial [Vulgatibacter sp.]
MDPIKTLINRPIFTSMLICAVVVFGLFAFPKMGVDQFPDVEFPVVTVTVVRPGADPESMERDVADPLEEVINTLSGLETLKSINVESVTQIIVQFELGKNVDVAAQEVRDKVQSQLSKLPPEIQTPVVDKFDIGAAPIMTLALSGPLPVEELTRIAEDEVKPMLQQQRGVGSIELIGGREREIRVEVNPDRLRGYGLAVTDVAMALNAQNVDIPGGRTEEPGRERTVKLTSQVKSVDEIRNLIIPAPTSAPVRIQDVANVIDGPEEARSLATFDGESAVALVVRKQSGANTVAVAEAIKEALPDVTSRLPDGMRVRMVNDGAKFIRSSIHSVQEDLLLGGILAVLIVLLFLRNGPSTIISALALPTSVIGTFAVMKALDFTFNNITM